MGSPAVSPYGAIRTRMARPSSWHHQRSGVAPADRRPDWPSRSRAVERYRTQTQTEWHTRRWDAELDAGGARDTTSRIPGGAAADAVGSATRLNAERCRASDLTNAPLAGDRLPGRPITDTIPPPIIAATNADGRRCAASVRKPTRSSRSRFDAARIADCGRAVWSSPYTL